MAVSVITSYAHQSRYGLRHGTDGDAPIDCLKCKIFMCGVFVELAADKR